MRTINNSEIEFLFYKHLHKSPDYFARFSEKLQKLTPNERAYWKNKDVPRLIAIFDFCEWIKKYSIDTGDKLLITCQDDPEIKYLSYKTVDVIEYPEYDLHTLSLSKKYNFVVFNQTIEHLYNPFLAMQNLYNSLESGGYLYTTVPTINIPHMTPYHFWGVTPMGLMALGLSVGFNVVECGFWGNRAYMQNIFGQTPKWPDYTEVFENETVTHDPHCQAQTWVLLEKP